MIATRDMTAFIIATIHLNLCLGTLSAFADGRPDLSDLFDELLEFRACGEFMLTELGHGLDARNLETTATLLPNGAFDLHCPNEAAWKAMPPSIPLTGIPRIAVVFARLIVDTADHGLKPFIVRLSDSKGMLPGIVSRLLPTRPGTKPLDHSITSFDHVKLPATALLESKLKPENPRADFLRQIWRVSVGTLALSIMGVSSIRISSAIALTYSRRRMVGAGADIHPILRFSTQLRPILRGMTSGVVLDALARHSVQNFTDQSLSPSVRNAFAAIFKATVVKESTVLTELVERCGWRGLFAINQINELALTFQGNSIAEGDTLVLCIRASPIQTLLLVLLLTLRPRVGFGDPRKEVLDS